MKSQLFIPSKIKVGFNLRNDTYTGKLGYIIAHDGKVWRKEKSWEGWRLKYSSPEELYDLKVKQFNDSIESQKKSHQYCIDYYQKNPKDSYYKKYADMTELEYLTQYDLNDFDKWCKNNRFNGGMFSDNEGIKPVEFENVPTEGFVLNKKAGGYSTGWNHRSTYCRVYDPRGFEFEISIPNLLFILQETSAVKGKGLEGEFVYSWDGKDLVLLPAHCEEYKQSAQFTKLQAGKVGVKDLIEGCAYKTKQTEEWTYLGKFNWFERSYYSNNKDMSYSKQYVFIDKTGKYHPLTSLTSLSARITDTPVDNYSELVDALLKSENSGPVKDFEAVKSSLNLPKKVDYYYYNYGKKMVLEGCYFQEIGPNKFKHFTLEVVAGEEAADYRSYGDRKVKGFHLKPNKVVAYENGDLTIKAIAEKDEKLYSHAEIAAMEFKTLSFVNNDNTKYKLTV